MNKTPATHYRIIPKDPAAHLFSVAIHVAEPDPKGQEISFATWIPGSYLIRDFSQHVEQMKALDQNGQELAVTPLSQSRWKIAPCQGRLTIHYYVYAWDLSVRGAHLDQQHGFFNGTSVFAEVCGLSDEPCLVDILPPKGVADSWKVYTSLNEAEGFENAAPRHGFGRYFARDYDELIDHPVEMGTPKTISFEAGGTEHELVFTGITPNIDLERIAADCQRICQTEIDMFEPQSRQAPFADTASRYVFMVMVTENGYGGLEHRSSTALMTGRNALPIKGKDQRTPEYTQFLGLVSHEYFHSWNVKRIKPQRFTPYDLSQATPTKLLWVFEGFTSYYDDLFLLRSGLIEQAEYLRLLERTINNVLPAAGARKQSIAQSSYDAGNKYYRQNENSPNAIVSYYTKGALTAMCLDLYLRAETDGQRSLDDVMRLMWQEYGRDFYKGNQAGIEEEGMVQIVREACDVDISDFVQCYVDGTEPLPLEELLFKSGSRVRLKKSPNSQGDAWLGLKTRKQCCQLMISHVAEGSPAHLGGLSGLDTLAAIDGLQVRPDNFETLMKHYRPGDEVTIYVFRRDELQAYRVVLGEMPAAYQLYVED